MENIVNVLFSLVFAIAITESSIIGQPDTFDQALAVGGRDVAIPLSRAKREDVVKYLVDSVDGDIDKCGSPLQIENDRITISIGSLTCIVQALVDSLNAGPGLLRKLLDNILKKRDLAAVDLKSSLTRGEEECAMRAIIKEAIEVIKAEHAKHQRQKRRADNRCAKIEKQIEEAMKKQMKEKHDA